MDGQSKPDRPLLVTIVGVLNIISGILIIIGGVVFLPLIVPGILSVVVGVGMLKGWKIFWYLGVIVTVIELIASVFLLVVIVGIIPLAINALILYYLFRPNVKAFFGVN